MGLCQKRGLVWAVIFGLLLSLQIYYVGSKEYIMRDGGINILDIQALFQKIYIIYLHQKYIIFASTYAKPFFSLHQK